MKTNFTLTIRTPNQRQKQQQKFPPDPSIHPLKEIAFNMITGSMLRTLRNWRVNASVRESRGDEIKRREKGLLSSPLRAALFLILSCNFIYSFFFISFNSAPG
jgi:hypothetical protein